MYLLNLALNNIDKIQPNLIFGEVTQSTVRCY